MHPTDLQAVARQPAGDNGNRQIQAPATEARPHHRVTKRSNSTRVGQTIIWDRNKTIEEKLTEVNMLLSKMPAGEEDWDSCSPRTDADVDNLFWRLTLQDKFARHVRAQMSYVDLLRQMERLVTEAPSYEKQIFKVVSVGLGRIATKLGPMLTKEVFETTDGTHSELRWARVAVSRIIDAADVLATFGLGERAYELSIRRDKLSSTVGRFTREHFALLVALLRVFPEKVYKPIKHLKSAKLRIPTVLFEMLGGSDRIIQEKGKERPMTLADIAGVLEVQVSQPQTCYHSLSTGMAISPRPLKPDEIQRILSIAGVQSETRRLEPSRLQDQLGWQVLDASEVMYDK